MILLALLLWYSIGVCSIIYWVTSEFDFTADYIPLAIIIGLLGPFVFLIGYLIHGDTGGVLIKKRTK
jgi:hypothetical protein